MLGFSLAMALGPSRAKTAMVGEGASVTGDTGVSPVTGASWAAHQCVLALVSRVAHRCALAPVSVHSCTGRRRGRRRRRRRQPNDDAADDDVGDDGHDDGEDDDYDEAHR